MVLLLSQPPISSASSVTSHHDRSSSRPRSAGSSAATAACISPLRLCRPPPSICTGSGGSGSNGRRGLHPCSHRFHRRVARVDTDASAGFPAGTRGDADPEVTRGYTMTQFCDKMIEVFLLEKPQTKEWRKILVFRDDWKKYGESFYARCKARVDAEADEAAKQKLSDLARKVKRIDEEMEQHSDLLKEIEQNPADINAVVARRRKDFTGDFFRHINILSEVNDSLDDRDAMTRLGVKCLSAVSAYDNAVENLEMLESAQAKFDDILNSSSLEVACEKINSLAKSKELDSSLILLINRAWAAAKESPTMKNEVKDIMYQIYKATKSSLKSIAPREIKLLKHLLNITDPEERFSALASAFSPGTESEIKDDKAMYSTPKELHKWIKIMLDAYELNKEETDLAEARKLTHPVIIQRLFFLKETIEEEYLNKKTEQAEPVDEEIV